MIATCNLVRVESFDQQFSKRLSAELVRVLVDAVCGVSIECVVLVVS